MTALVSTLVACGALPHKKRGPQNPRSPDEAKRVKHEQDVEARTRRKMLIEEARAQGLPLPAFVRGRPRKYTEEEALDVKRSQWKVGYGIYKERLKQGLEALKLSTELHDQQVR